MDQAKALGGQGAPAREAVTTADCCADSTLGGATGGHGTQVARAERATSSVAPQEYYRPNALHVADNKAEFEKRKTCGACFACLNTRVQYGTFHL
jgi:hypothetical protein